MPILIENPRWEARIRRRRQITGADRYDETWDGVYIVSPLPDDEHQRLIASLATVLTLLVSFPGLGEVRPGVNVSDRVRGWKDNYRIPDVAVRLNDGRARILKKHWVGGPDFAVEVISKGDRSRKKLDFYASLGSREVLIVDRDPWSLELYSLRGDQLIPSGVGRVGTPEALASTVLPLTFRLVAGEPKPQIEVVHNPDGRSWRV